MQNKVTELIAVPLLLSAMEKVFLLLCGVSAIMAAAHPATKDLLDKVGSFENRISHIDT